MCIRDSSKCNQLQHMVCVGYGDDSHPVDYKCPICWMNEPLVESAATLIVVPSNLAAQWQNEVRKFSRQTDECLFLPIVYFSSFLCQNKDDLSNTDV